MKCFNFKCERKRSCA